MVGLVRFFFLGGGGGKAFKFDCADKVFNSEILKLCAGVDLAFAYDKFTPTQPFPS